MYAAVDFGLTNVDVVVQRNGSCNGARNGARDGSDLFERCMIPSTGTVDVPACERALAATGHALGDFERVAVTGGQHRRLPARIGTTEIVGVGEVTAIGRGGLYLAGMDEALVVSAGSGTAMVAARPGEVHHVTGSAVGGGTLQGLARLLLGTTDPQQIDALALAGNSNAVDLTLLEATGGVLGRLPADANAVNFGRMARPGPAPAREDIAAGLAVMVGQVIAVIAINAARAEGLKHVVVVGHLVDLPCMRRVLETVAGYYQASITVPAMPGTAMAIGALLAARFEEA